jgi:hypothetical protein
MDITDTNLESVLKQMVQRYLFIYRENRVIKRGKLILFRQNNFNIDLHLITPKKIPPIIYSLPIPFDTTIKNNKQVIFDYKLSRLVKNNVNMYNQLIHINPAKKSKFYNTEICIEMDPGL